MSTYFLVAHSMGGVVASQVAEQRPDSIKAIVYLSAYLLRTSESLFQVASADKDAQIGPYFVVNETQGIIGIREEGLKAVFLHDCADEDVARARALSRSEAVSTLSRTREYHRTTLRASAACVH